MKFVNLFRLVTRVQDKIIIANKYFENVGKFKELRKTNTNQNCIHEEIKFEKLLLIFNSKSFVFRPLTRNGYSDVNKTYFHLFCCLGVKLGVRY
jgi:hypothetical protein